MFIVLQNGKRSCEPSVFWLHSLYDPPLSDFSEDQRGLMPFRTLLASAVLMADIVVTSTGILKDAREFEWPDQLKELQRALTVASAEHRVLTVESMGCLPEGAKNSQNKMIQSSNLENLQNVPITLCSFPGPTVGRQRTWHFRGDCGATASGQDHVCGGAATRAASTVGESVSQRSYLLVALAHAG